MTDMSQIKLEAKLVGEISGEFFVPSYQRGYRWGEDEVTRLLDDIYANGTKNYCLQPIVVKRKNDKYELIDGQQRLTTLYLIFKYMYIASGGFFFSAPKFSLEYETRSKSAEFLDKLDMSQINDNIDFYFIGSAYTVIQQWFENRDKQLAMINVAKYLSENVKVIWYEVGEEADSIALFTRLNIGKIPLTSAELVKAMFLSKDNNPDMTRQRQEEISLQWDNIEKELHNNSLWYFLTNNANVAYQTRIDLVLDLIARKSVTNKDKYATFFFFDQKQKSENLSDIWAEILRTFLLLKDWFENHELYHLIGYLIASDTKTLQDVFDMSKDSSKEQFKNALKQCIKESIHLDAVNYADLSYDKANEAKKISKLLLLFNIESVRQNGEHTQWFPFEKYKFNADGKVVWSLEHIHAQQSEGMKTQEHWVQWITLHRKAIKEVYGENEELLKRMDNAICAPKLERAEFEAIQNEVVDILSTQGSTEYMHSISNLALLNTSDNAALNNSTFAVKRNQIIEMDKKGQFIPFCTKMVFLKYYTDSENNQVNFWGQADRVAYISAINDVLDEYLDTKILLGKEQN